MRIPVATYRLQFNPAFGFRSAKKIIKYLTRLGISDIYASPIFRAKKGSLHGYDVVDPNQLNPELGTTKDFALLTEEARKNGLGWVQDIIPNHMAFDSENEMLMDVLEKGQGSDYFSFFDIDWDHSYEGLRGRVLAPFLGRFYGESLEDGEMKLIYGPTGLMVRYYDFALPVRIESYHKVFSRLLAPLKSKLGEDNPGFVRLLGALYVLKTLASEEETADRNITIQFIKQLLWNEYSHNPDFKKLMNRNVRILNGRAGKPETFTFLDDLLVSQLFKLSYWKVATKEINYRRFFNINDLISLRVQDEEVFDRTHQLVFDLLNAGAISGLRIDHLDGLYDPAGYLHRIREKAPATYLIVEKILDLDEDLCEPWPVQGTTGYDFINYVTGLFCDRKNSRTFNRAYANFTGFRGEFSELAREKKKLIIVEHMAGDVNNLAQLVRSISSRDRHGRDITMYGLRRAIMEVLAAFPVYRTYVDQRGLGESDRKYIQDAIDAATAVNPALINELKFVRRFLLLQFPPYLGEENKREWLQFAMRFQQFTGPLMAKGFEDTTLYVYNRLLSLNEVGGKPDRFGCSVKKFHSFNRKRQRRWPASLNATSTHDTKRGEDVRARINVLSEIPLEWEQNLRNWNRINKAKKERVKGTYVPDKNDEYFLYQTLLGAFPFSEEQYVEFVARIKEYMIKAVREAKVHTEWIQPDTAYEEAYLAFLDRILEPSDDNAFLKEFRPFQRKISHYGVLNSLSQALIKITAPGVPDFYQGTELWDLNLVDPDNRRTVDFETRAALLEDLRSRATEDQRKLIHELLANVETGKIKLFLVHRALQARNDSLDTFQKGRYTALRTYGRFEHNIVAFARNYADKWSVTIAPRFLCEVVPDGDFPLGDRVWQDTGVLLPEHCARSLSNVFTQDVISVDNVLSVGQALKDFPVGLLIGKS
ncbi:MAG: malto-oligosyltrehalose synthase [Desulfomonile tiedjei]|nr:malto-oligosyltrehalose synthase [Desulfomonile tiedjei]